VLEGVDFIQVQQRQIDLILKDEEVGALLGC